MKIILAGLVATTITPPSTPMADCVRLLTMWEQRHATETVLKMPITNEGRIYSVCRKATRNNKVPFLRPLE
jgi:hypothetical protein